MDFSTFGTNWLLMAALVLVLNRGSHRGSNLGSDRGSYRGSHHSETSASCPAPFHFAADGVFQALFPVLCAGFYQVT